jgi:hypothetical protein
MLDHASAIETFEANATPRESVALRCHNVRIDV